VEDRLSLGLTERDERIKLELGKAKLFPIKRKLSESRETAWNTAVVDFRLWGIRSGIDSIPLRGLSILTWGDHTVQEMSSAGKLVFLISNIWFMD